MATPDRPGAQEWVPPDASLETLRSAAQQCHGCELFADATQTVMGDGDPAAPLVLLGEVPGDQEDQQGRPFVGPAGQLLVSALGEAGIDPRATYRTNVVKHFRWEGTRGKQRLHKTPTQAHVKACAPWLAAELTLLKPRGVVVLGATAGKALLGSTFKVTEERGRLREWPADAPGQADWMLATTHPSAVLRSQERDRDFAHLVADLRVVAEALAAPR
jgi:DNA polymerase